MCNSNNVNMNKRIKNQMEIETRGKFCFNNF